MKKALTVIGFLVAIWTIAFCVWPLSGMYEWKNRPWVRLQAGEVIVESTLVVEDTIATDFIVPDDSGTVHLAGWADSSSWADTSAWADSSSHALNADSLGGTIVVGDVVLKDWAGLDEWGASLTADTIEIIGVTAACPAFVTPHEVLSENVAAITKTDTLIVTRVVGGEPTDDGYSYLVMRP